MVTITCYYNRSDPKTIDKTIAPVGSGGTVLQGTLKEETSLLDPEILIEYDHVPEFNYIKIAEFSSRYYYVNQITCVRTNLYRISCHVDVLMSWWGSIKNTLAVMGRVETGYNKKMNDTMIPTERSINRSIVVSTKTSPFNEITQAPEDTTFTECFPYLLTVFHGPHS